jgi:hypothetical protein
MWVIVGILVFIVTCLVADRVDDHGLHGTTASWIMGTGTILAAAIVATQWL